MLERDIEKVEGLVVADVVAEVRDVVGKSAGVLQELTDGDVASVDPLPAYEARQRGFDRASRPICLSPTSCSTITALNILVLLPIRN
ncbi:hypothetical protein Sgleb_72420 [Streptomyces glebosus]|uniref:Uncharacterized protein n=1 Tax=Streptomyces glebosus TaxID=249580 RepID=A0A640TC10_9ACTN|nr:hypothetical protein Sgleb_72420 [Streptomyces glebosus]GHG77075.1 hypothetical protein GCM10010513_52490 [Streptomyces glebosus]